jgi:membrane associated rhomboid family serine protease
MYPEHQKNLFTRDWVVPAHAHIVPTALATLLSLAWLGYSTNGSMSGWALSWPGLHERGSWLLVLHIFAHGGLLHLIMNVSALMLVGGPLISRLGTPPLSWARFLYLFFGSGLAGAALFLAFHFGRPAAMMGASGAIFGIVGALARVHPATGEVVPLKSARTMMLAKLFLQNHLILLALVVIVALLTGARQGFAWEAHLGGLLFGFLATPLYLPPMIERVDDTDGDAHAFEPTK